MPQEAGRRVVHVVLVTHGLSWKRGERQGSPSLLESGMWCLPKQSCTCQPQGATLTEVRGDVPTQSELLGAYSGESSSLGYQKRHCIGR